VNLPIVYIALIFADALPISAFIKPLNNLLNIWLILVNHFAIIVYLFMDYFSDPTLDQLFLYFN